MKASIIGGRLLGTTAIALGLVGSQLGCASAPDSSGESVGQSEENVYWLNQFITQWYDATPKNTVNICYSGFFDWDTTQPWPPPAQHGQCASDNQCDTAAAEWCGCRPEFGSTCTDRVAHCAADPTQCGCNTGMRGVWTNDTSAYSTTKTWIRDALLAEWASAADIRFNFLDSCPPSPMPPNTMPIRMVETTSLGGLGGYAVYGLGSRAGDDPNQQGVDPEAQVAIGVFEGDPLSQLQMKATTVHEVGHALGLIHEHERPDRVNASCLPNLPFATTPQGNPYDYLTVYDPDSIMNYCRDVDGDGRLDGYTTGISPKLSALDIFGVQQLFGFPQPLDIPARGFCNGPNERPFAGRFDADARADLLCLNLSTGLMRVDLADANGGLSTVDWSATRSFCTGANQRLFVGDTNADGRDDLICNTATTGTVAVSLATSTGSFPSTTFTVTTGICAGPPAGSVVVGDFTGDRRADIACMRSNGSIQVDIADGNGRYAAVDRTATVASFCTSSTQVALAGDVDGDGKSDIVCYDRSNAQVSVLRSVYTGQAIFTTPSWTGVPASFPTGCELGSQLAFGELNGDGRKDLICRTSTALSAAFALPNGSYPVADFQGPFARWCSNLQDRFLSAPFRASGYEDLLCIGQNGDQSEQFPKTPTLSGRCTVSNSIDLSVPGTTVSVPNNACVMVRAGYPSWWGPSRAMQVQDPSLGPSPVPYEWKNLCSGGRGRGTFTRAWDDRDLPGINSACPTFFDLQGPGNGNIELRYYGR